MRADIDSLARFRKRSVGTNTVEASATLQLPPIDGTSEQARIALFESTLAQEELSPEHVELLSSEIEALEEMVHRRRLVRAGAPERPSLEGPRERLQVAESELDRLLSLLCHPEQGWLSKIEGQLDRIAREDRSRSDASWIPLLAELEVGLEPYGSMVMSEQRGLIPLGRNEQSGLFEFWHVASGDRPELSSSGEFTIQPETGMIFILMPAMRVMVGCQGENPSGLNYDPQQKAFPGWGPVVGGELGSFFLSKYEMTQGQYYRLFGERPSGHIMGYNLDGHLIDGRFPVESVSWSQAIDCLSRVGLHLPTEVRWEAAARYRQTELKNGLGVEEQKAHRYFNFRHSESAYRTVSPVDAYSPNQNGFYQLVGNVAEWCDGTYYAALDGLTWEVDSGCFQHRDSETFTENHPYRGGHWNSRVAYCRIAARFGANGKTTDNYVGLRPCREVER